jgi:CubicO group peptidase (beta-lactamase class C family)
VTLAQDFASKRPVSGPVYATDPRLEDALRGTLERGEIGVQTAVYVGGKLIAEGWAGVADLGNMRPVDASTLFPVFSVTKAITATALQIQIDRGLIDVDKPMATYWPEFAQNGKGAITVEQMLTHQSGIPQMPKGSTPERLCDWDWTAGRIAELEPLFEPGTLNAYQSYSFGWLAGEIVRRTDPKQRGFGQFVREEIAEPLGIDDLWIGLPKSKLDRGAMLVSDIAERKPGAETALSLAAKPDKGERDDVLYNRDDIRMACLPGGGAIVNARSAARFFSMLANGGTLDGVRLLSEERLVYCTTPRPNAEQPDQVLYGGNTIMPMGKGGFWLDGTVFGGGPGVLCHAGLGGSAGFADFESGLAVSICHNRLFAGFKVKLPNHPFFELGRAIREVAAPHLERLAREPSNGRIRRTVFGAVEA